MTRLRCCLLYTSKEWTEDEKYCSNLVRGYHYFGDLRVKLEDLFSGYTMQEIADICDQALIPGTMCSTTKEALQQPQLRVRNMIVSVNDTDLGELEMPGKPVKFCGEEEEPLSAAPEIGAQNEQVYTSLGIDAAAMENLHREGVI